MERSFATPENVPDFFSDMFRGFDPAVVRADFAGRYQVAREWISAAEDVGRAAADLPEAVETLAFIRSRLAPGFLLPGTGGYLFAAVADTDPRPATADARQRFRQAYAASRAAGGYEVRTLLAALTTLDRQAGPGEELGRLLGRWLPNSRIGADLSTGRLTRLLVLPPQSPAQRLSPGGKGVLMLYETRHTMGVSLASPTPESLDYWRAQAALTTFEFALLERLGGSAYADLVDRYAKALRREGDLLARPEKVLDRRMRGRLAQSFDGISDREAHLWASVAYRNAIARRFDDPDGFAVHLMNQAT